jgi:hypothetical protein
MYVTNSEEGRGPMAVLNGTRRITTHEAQLKSAAAEVKALTISGKQVTLSVFRQLQEEELLDRESAQLRGVPWGHVNYYWGECKADHLHVVWQKGEELRRGAALLVRHFAHYTEEAPLFGKYTGTFYIPMHVRGRAEQGAVVKDYRVLAPSEGAPQ